MTYRDLPGEPDLSPPDDPITDDEYDYDPDCTCDDIDCCAYRGALKTLGGGRYA